VIFGVPAKVVSTAFALGAFVVAIIAGLAAQNPSRVVLFDAMIALVVCNVIGLVIGAVMEHAVNEHVDRYRAEHRIPELEMAGASTSSAQTGEILDVDQGVDN
jgi:tetrahydromethanopterin S-methyltransferase subunit C